MVFHKMDWIATIAAIVAAATERQCCLSIARPMRRISDTTVTLQLGDLLDFRFLTLLGFWR